MFELAGPIKFDVFYHNPRPQSGRYMWIVPKTAKMLYWWGCGGGGGGGGGCSGAQDTQRGGGAGGCGGNTICGFAPTIMLPEVLYIEVGAGGEGGGPDTDGVNGGATGYTYTETSLTGIGQGSFFVAGGPRGQKGTTTAGGVSANTGSTLGTIGFDFATNLIGGSGGSGGLTGSGSTTTPTSNTHTTGGAGGGGCPATYVTGRGGDVNITNQSFSTGSVFGGEGGAAAGNPGGNGYTVWADKQPFNMLIRSVGGAGGGNSNTGTGGNGGFGGIGSGGGGGGAGLTGGTGGRGGDGVLILAYW